MALIPADRLIDWTPGTHVGVIGGIPTDRNTLIDVTQAPYNADNTGSVDTSSAIQSAIDAATSGQVVYLPAGTYLLDNPIFMGTNFSGKSFRGDGIGITVIDANCNVPINIGSASGFSYPDPPVLVESGLSKGSTAITVSDPSEFNVDELIILLIKGDESIPVASVYNYDVETNQSPCNQVVRVTGVSGDDLSIWPPLYDDYGGGSLEVRVAPITFQANGIGFEDLTVDCTTYTGGGGTTGSFAGISVSNCYGSWIKNVRSRKAYNYAVNFGSSLNCEIRGSWFGELKGGGTNGGGLLFSGYACLVEDIVLHDAFPLLEMNGGACGNVIGYSFGTNGGNWDSNHSPHNQFNLFEGNMGAYHMSDGYFGSEARLTHYRNYWREISMNLRRFTRDVSAVGNILSGQIGCGLPFFSAGTYSGEAQLSLGDPWRDWQMTAQLTNRVDDGEGDLTLNSGALFGGDGQVIRLVWGAGLDQQRFALVHTSVDGVARIINYSGGTALPIVGTEINVGPGSYYSGVAEDSSYCELDLDVEATLIKKGNYYIDSVATDPLGGDVLVDSLYTDLAGLEARGVDWGAYPYPPVDPESPEEVTLNGLPAGRRFFAEEPSAPPEITTPCTVSGSPVEGQILTGVPGLVTGNPPPTRTWKWQRDGVDIVGATSQTYLLVEADVGFDVGPVQIETNGEDPPAESVAAPMTILAFTGDQLVVTQVANASPVTELWLRGALTSGVSAPLAYYLVQHSGPYPTQPDNNFVYARFGTPQDNVYVFQGTISEAEAIASVP